MRMLIAAALTGLCLAGCTPSDDRKANEDLKSAAANARDTVHEGLDSPSGEALKDDVKDVGSDIGTALKKGAGELAEGAKDAKAMMDQKVQQERARAPADKK